MGSSALFQVSREHCFEDHGRDGEYFGGDFNGCFAGTLGANYKNDVSIGIAIEFAVHGRGFGFH